MFDFDTVPVRLSDGTEILARVASTGETKVSAEGIFDFKNIRQAIASLAQEINSALDRNRPDKVSVKFSLELSAKSGKLTAVLVEGGGKAALEVALEWQKHGTPAPANNGPAEH